MKHVSRFVGGLVFCLATSFIATAFAQDPCATYQDCIDEYDCTIDWCNPQHAVCEHDNDNQWCRDNYELCPLHYDPACVPEDSKNETGCVCIGQQSEPSAPIVHGRPVRFIDKSDPLPGQHEFEIAFSGALADWYGGPGHSLGNYGFWLHYFAGALNDAYYDRGDGSTDEVRAFVMELGQSWLRNNGPGDPDTAIYFICVQMEPLLENTPPITLPCDE